MKGNKQMLWICFALSFSGNVSANIYPEGFEEFFSFIEKRVKLRNLDGTYTHVVPLEVKFDEVKLDPNNTAAVQQVKQYLLDNSVSEDNVSIILSSLLEGVSEQGLCAGNKKTCSLQPTHFQWVQNFNENELYLFVAPSVLDYSYYSEDRSYHNPLSIDNGLINSFDLYANRYSNQDASISFNNVSTLGLPYGYLKADFSLANNGNSELFDASYHADIESFAFKAGTFQYAPNVNSTGFLNSGYRFPHHGVYFGSSKNLLVGGERSDKSISFYAPRSGNVEVYRDGRLIYQRSIKEGHNTLSYQDLPSGRYEITVHVVNNGEVVDRQTYQIYNTSNDSLKAGDIDYLISSGVFSGSYYDYDDQNEMEGEAFGKGLLSYRPFDPLLLGVSGLLSNEASMLSSGASLYWLQTGLSSELTYSVFDDADYLSANLGLGSVNIAYEKLNNEEHNPLASFLFGYDNFERLSLNGSYNLGRGRSLYATYTYVDMESLGNGDYYIEPYDYSTVTLGFSSPSIISSLLNIYADYNDLSDEVSMNITWLVPLSEEVEVITGINSSQGELTQFSNTIRKENLWNIENVDNYIELGNWYDRKANENYQTASLNFNGDNDFGRMNMRLFASTNSYSGSGVSLGLSSTQVVTGEDVYLTNKRANSYAVIDVDHLRNNEEDVDTKGYVSVEMDDRQSSRFVATQDETLIPLTDYKRYQTNFDAESVELHNSGDAQLNTFSHPGTVAVLNPQVSKVVSFVSAFNDLNERAVEDVSCEGDGCLSVSEMTDGVFKVTVLEGLAFELTSQENTCLLPYELSSSNQMNFGNNYCLPLDEEGATHLVTSEGKDLKIYFLGAFSPTQDFLNTVDELEELGFEVITKPVGELSAVYISNQPEKFDQLFSNSRELIDSVKALAATRYKLDSIAYTGN
ncbi:TcfC E-set like domain-containing protein [Vibrio antiquarius]|uniref:TcfC E-set like domain-containing protein n=1 Tax=Vibrio antiquarius (strain Ex25) TaxID=150340 RepID=UPI002659AC18|nr:TcfC E-set like domain-containing protein [Vibrio antiquarius]EHR5764739.1 TcfC E-set like domain-containing protein [Vibrio parahaemolyticus]EHY0932557.1 TcfC E-set like domain-containing protein [Vibrio parahaemolyticus]EIZ0312364.1 TcfC E-set like domain-containing protein [Vibrio parahaemolyticus]MCR9547217.1 TcfC E-set like domain-containing protein [Vibrio antiquarius]